MDPVTEALLGRLQPDGGIQRMMGLSLAAHVVALAALVLMASGWRGGRTGARARGAARRPRTPPSRTPTTGPELRPGTAAADTSGRGEGFGLSSGGGRGIGSPLRVRAFCLPAHLL